MGVHNMDKSKFHQESDNCVHNVDTEMAFSHFHDLLAMTEERKETSAVMAACTFLNYLLLEVALLGK